MSSFAFGMILIAAGVVAYVRQPRIEAARMDVLVQQKTRTRGLAKFWPRIRTDSHGYILLIRENP